jgi:hypothetical protein
MSNTSLAPTLATPLGTTLATSPAPASPSTGTDQHAVAVAVRARAALSVAELAELNRRFEDASASEIVEWASERFGDGLCLTASFADTVLIELATRVDPDIEVIFLDTASTSPRPSTPSVGRWPGTRSTSPSCARRRRGRRLGRRQRRVLRGPQGRSARRPPVATPTPG